MRLLAKRFKTGILRVHQAVVSLPADGGRGATRAEGFCKRLPFLVLSRFPLV
jgi:hypothetical protein